MEPIHVEHATFAKLPEANVLLTAQGLLHRDTLPAQCAGSQS